MFDEVLGIPAHPLIVHAAVIFVPLQILAAYAYALVPFTRRYIAWAVIALAVIGPVASFAAKESGEKLQERLVKSGMTDLAQINEHADYAGTTLWFSLGLGVLMLVLVFLVAKRRPAATAPIEEDAAESASAGGAARVLALAVGVIMLLSGAATGYYIFKTGDTGAHIVWSGI